MLQKPYAAQVYCPCQSQPIQLALWQNNCSSAFASDGKIDTLPY